MSTPHSLPEHAEWNEDRLFVLLEGLRGTGFSIGIKETLRTLKAAQASRAAGSEADPKRLRQYLGPVVCTNPEQQKDFHRQFNDWWLHHCGGRWEDVGALPPPPPLAEREAYEVVEKTRPWKWWLVAYSEASRPPVPRQSDH